MKNRINAIIQSEGHTPSSFADAIGVSRSSMNHILNGRNNPSLEVTSKILSTFPHIHSDWLIFGKDPMYRNQTNYFQPDLFHQAVVKAPDDAGESKYSKENELSEPVSESKVPIINGLNIQEPPSKKISKIIILYTDKTFDTLSIEN